MKDFNNDGRVDKEDYQYFEDLNGDGQNERSYVMPRSSAAGYLTFMRKKETTNKDSNLKCGIISVC